MQPSPQQARPARRILALALPHLAAEAALRREGLRGIQAPFAVVEKQGSALRLASVTAAALAAGLAPGQGLADARAICPGLLTRPAMPERHTALLRALARWAERFSPLVGLDMADTLILDITGVGHLFGSEAELAAKAVAECAALSLTARAGLAETRGAAWALAHYGAFAAPSNPSTLSTPSTQPARGAGAKRRSAPARQSGGDQPLPAATLPNGFADAVAIVPPRRLRAMLAPLPVAALRLDEAAVEGLMALGLGTLGEMAGVPRGQIARRFGVAVLRRLDQALGVEPEPVSPLRARPVFSARLTLPEPIGLTSDVMAGLERLLERVCADLARAHEGARRLCLIARRVDASDALAEIRLARPMRDPMRLRDLFQRKVGEMEAGFGIDALRLVATETEPLKPVQTSRRTEAERLDDLLSRIGNRIGFERVTRLLPNESHIPERGFTVAAAAWSEPEAFPPGRPRPLVLFNPVWLDVPDGREPPENFVWRGARMTRRAAWGPERIAPEWWWDDPAWRTGARDYWRVQTDQGPRLWFYRSYYPAPQWWVQGVFA